MVGSGACAGGGDIGADIALWCCGAVGVVLGVRDCVCVSCVFRFHVMIMII